MFPELARLFATPARIKVLKFFVLQPEARVSSSAVSGVIGVPKKNTEDELRSLVRLGVLVSRKQKKTTLFSVDHAHPLGEPLRAFFDMTTAPSNEKILDAFKGVRGLTLVIATGTLANESRGAVDLLVVTKKPKDSRVTRAVKRLEAAIALPLRYAILEAEDYRSRLESYDRLLRDVFEFEHRFIVGKRAGI